MAKATFENLMKFISKFTVRPFYCFFPEFDNRIFYRVCKDAIDFIDFSEVDMPWFPRKISDLDRAQKVLMYGSELDADHPVCF